MPGPTSDSSKGPGADTPFVPSWCYPNNDPPMCACGHHDGWHGNTGCIKRGCHCGAMHAVPKQEPRP
jgi:hypothetical protein